MISHDERLDYYLMVTRLMAEAESQLEADAGDRGCRGYAEELEILRDAIQGAQQAAARIVLKLVTSPRGLSDGEPDGIGPNARH